MGGINSSHQLYGAIIMDYEKYEDYKFEELFFDNLFKKEEKAVEESEKHMSARKKLFSKRII